MSNDATHGVLLAAGAGSRFRNADDEHGHKLLARLPALGKRPAETVIERSLSALIDAELGAITVVTGFLTERDLMAIASPSASPLRHADVDYRHNPRWADGQASSVQVGIDAADRRECDVAIVGLADQPGVRSSAWRSVATAGHAGARIAVATYGTQRGNPVALHRDVWALVASSGDEGARSLMRIRGDLVVPVSCQGQPDDIDTVEDLRTWQSN